MAEEFTQQAMALGLGDIDDKGPAGPKGIH
jgi:hypothetical protein